jgi:hypothetical protein
MSKLLVIAAALIFGYTLFTIPNLSGLPQRDYDHALKEINTGAHTHDIKHGGRFKPMKVLD